MDLQESIAHQTDIAFDLAKLVASTIAKDSNLVLSPLSIHVILSLIAAGSSGSTRDQMLSFLKSKSSNELNSFSFELIVVVFANGSSCAGPHLSFANGIWVDKSMSLRLSFKHVLDESYKAAFDKVDFQKKALEMTNHINMWAKRETNGLIKDVLPPGAVDSTTRLLFANALYFKGSWNEKFDATSTKVRNFYLTDGSSIEVPFMTSKKKQYMSAFGGFKALGLPYKHGEDTRRFTMYIFLPDAKEGLPALVERVGSGSGFFERHLPSEKVEVGSFWVPRFMVSFGFEASEVLKGLGVTLPFSEEAGLTEMVAFLRGGWSDRNGGLSSRSRIVCFKHFPQVCY